MAGFSGVNVIAVHASDRILVIHDGVRRRDYRIKRWPPDLAGDVLSRGILAINTGQSMAELRFERDRVARDVDRIKCSTGTVPTINRIGAMLKNKLEMIHNDNPDAGRQVFLLAGYERGVSRLKFIEAADGVTSTQGVPKFHHIVAGPGREAALQSLGLHPLDKATQPDRYVYRLKKALLAANGGNLSENNFRVWEVSLDDAQVDHDEDISSSKEYVDAIHAAEVASGKHARAKRKRADRK